MIFKKINFRLVSIILLFFCTQQIKCKTISKRSIMQELMSNFMQMLDPKSNQKQMPYKIIKSETVDGAVQKYTVPNVDDEKMKDLNNAIKLLSIQSMLNRHYKNQYRKHKMMKEMEYLNEGNENDENFKKLNEHTIKKYKYIDSYNNHRFNKEMIKLQKQAQKLMESSPDLFNKIQDQHRFVKNTQDHLNPVPDFYTNSHGPEQNVRPKHINEPPLNTQQTSQMFLLSPNDISIPGQSIPASHVKYVSPGKLRESPNRLKYFSIPVSKEPFTILPYPHVYSSGAQRLNTKEQSYSRPLRGPKDIPWSIKHKAPEEFRPYQQEVPWSVVPLPPPLPTLNMVSSNNKYTWKLGSIPQSFDDNTATNSNTNNYWALKPLPPPMQTAISSRDMKASGSQISKDCQKDEDVTLESTSDPFVINTYAKNSPLKTDLSNENYDDLHITQESTLKTYTIDNRNNKDSKRDKEDSQQKESTVQQYSINPILAQQYQRYSNQQKNIAIKVSNSTQSGNDNTKQKDISNNKNNKKQEQIQPFTNHKDHNSTTYIRKYTPKNQKQLINPEQTQNLNVNQEKIIQQRQQQLKQFYEKQKQQRQQIRNNNKNLIADSKNIQDSGGRSYMFNSKLNTQQTATIPIDIAIPIEESDWIPIQPKYKLSTVNSNVGYDEVPMSSSNKMIQAVVDHPVSNIDVMLVFTNETKVIDADSSSVLDKKEDLKRNEETSQRPSVLSKLIRETENIAHLETKTHISNDKIENVDKTIREMTFNKPIYNVPIMNNKSSVASEKTVVIEVVNSDSLDDKKNLNSVEDIEGSESNIIPVKIRYDNVTQVIGNTTNNDQLVRQYERVKIKVKKIGKVDSTNQNQKQNIHNLQSYSTNSSDIISHRTNLFHHKLQSPLEASNNSLSAVMAFQTSTSMSIGHDKNDTAIQKSEIKNLTETSGDFNKNIVKNGSIDNGQKLLDSLSLVSNKGIDAIKNTTSIIFNEKFQRDLPLKNDSRNTSKVYDELDLSEEYEPSSTNIRELIANRSKIIRPFFRNKQNLTFSTTTTTTSTTVKPIILQNQTPEPIKDQKFEESKTQNNYDDYDEQLSFENIKAAQAFNFPKTDISYSVNTPKSSQSVYKSITNEKVVNANRKQNLRNKYRGESRHQNSPKKNRDQSDYENREEQTHISPTYDKNVEQYSVYENTAPFEGGGSTFYNDDDTSSNDGVDLKNIKIPSPDEIDLDSIDIPNPETIGVKSVSSGNNEYTDGEKDGEGDDNDSDNDGDNDNEGDIDEENDDDTDNEESKTRKQIDKSLKQESIQQTTQQNNRGQENIDSEKSHSEKNFDISSIPIPEYNEVRMNHIKEKYNIPKVNNENVHYQEEKHNEEHQVLLIPKDHLVKNDYNDEIPNYNFPVEFSQEQNRHGEEVNDETYNSYQNNFEESQRTSDPNLNMYTLNNENHNFPYNSAADKFRMRNLMKKPAEDQFDQDENFGYAKFSDENQEDVTSDDFRSGADEKRDSAINKFNNPTQYLSQLRSMPTKYPEKVIESHIVKQIPIAFKTVIKPVHYDTGQFSPLAEKFKTINSGIQQPFRTRTKQNGALLGPGRHTFQDKRIQSQYSGRDNQLYNEQFGRSLQSEIVPTFKQELSPYDEKYQETPHNQYKQVPYAPTTEHSQEKFNIPKTNEQTDYEFNFNPTAEIRSQLGSTISQIESSNTPSSQNIVSNPTKVKSFSDFDINQHHIPSSHPIRVPTGSNRTTRINQYAQSFIRQPESMQTFSNYFSPNEFQNQLETPSPQRTSQSSTDNFKQGLVVYHPTNSQVKSISHVLITPPTVERQPKYMNQPQIQEKNFQHTTVNPTKSNQKRVKVQNTRVRYESNATPSSTRPLDTGRYRYLKNYNNNNQPTHTLHHINQHNRIPQQTHRPNNPTAPPNANKFRDIPIRDQYKNNNQKSHLPSPRPKFTLQQIQSIKSSNLPPHINEFSEFNRPAKYDLSQIKNYHPTQIPYIQTPQIQNYYEQSIPLEQNDFHVYQKTPAQHQIIPESQHDDYNYEPNLFGKYNENSDAELPNNDEPNESEDDTNNSEEIEDNEERVRPKDPVHHDTDSKEHYLYNNNPQHVGVPHHNEFVQNIKLLKKMPKIEKLRVTNEYTNVNVNQYNKYHPENTQPHFLPTPTPEMHVTTQIKHKGKGKTLVFTPSQLDPFSNNLEIENPGYTSKESIPPQNLQSPIVTQLPFNNGFSSLPTSLPQFNHQLQSSPVTHPHFIQNSPSSTVSPPHFPSTHSSIPEHPLPLSSPQQYLPPTTPLTPYYTTARPEEQAQFNPPERDHFIQIQTPIQSTYSPFQQQIQGLGHLTPQLSVQEEPRPQFYMNQQYPYEIQQENHNVNHVLSQQPILENYSPPQAYVQHQLPRPQQRLPLGFPPNPDLQHFDIHNPQAAPIQIPHPHHHNGYSPNMEQYQLPEHPLLGDQQYIPLQNVNSPGRMIHTIYPYKKSDENHSNEQDDYYFKGNDFSNESQKKSENGDKRNQYILNKMNKRYRNIAYERNSNQGNKEFSEPNTSQTELINSRTDSKLQFDYVDSKTRIQPHGMKNLEENFKLEESRKGRKTTQDVESTKENIGHDTIENDKPPGMNVSSSEVIDDVQEYIDAFNRQESKQTEQVTEPDIVIQKSLQTEYRLVSQEEENTHEENRFIPLNYRTPIYATYNTASSNQNGNIQTFQLPGKIYENALNNSHGNVKEFEKTATNFNGQVQQSPQFQINHFTEHITNTHGEKMQDINANNHGSFNIANNYKTLDSPKHLFPSNNSHNPEKNYQNFVNTVPRYFQSNANVGNFLKSPFEISIKSPVDKTNPVDNINPSHYSIKNTDMPTVTFNTAGNTIYHDKPNVNTFVQFAQPNAKVHENFQSPVKNEPNIIIPQNFPLVLNPAVLIKTHSQSNSNRAQNEKIKIIIPTLTEQHKPVQSIKYNVPKGEVQINRFFSQIKPNSKQTDPTIEPLQMPQPFQNKNIMSQLLPFSNTPVIPNLHNLGSIMNHKQNQNQPFTPSTRQTSLNRQNIIQIPKNSQSTFEPQQILQPQQQILQLNQNNKISQFYQNQQNLPQVQQNQEIIKNIPKNHQHYDIFGEYGQKKHYKEPYKFEPLNMSEKNKDNTFTYTTNNQFNVQPGSDRYGYQSMQFFQPYTQNFNPNSNLYNRNQYQHNYLKPVQPELSEPVLVPSNLVNGLESESLISKKVKHPSIHDLTFQQSEQSTRIINITGTNLVNPYSKNKTEKSNYEQPLVDKSKLGMTPLMTFLSISQSINEEPNLKDSVPEDDSTTPVPGKTSNVDQSKVFHFENNNNNIPIMSFKDHFSAEEITRNEALRTVKSSQKKFDLTENKNGNDKIKLESASNQKPVESYEKIENFNDNVGVYNEDFEVRDLSFPRKYTELHNKNTKLPNREPKMAIFEKYMDSLNKSYDIIRESIKKEDDKDKIDISGLYNIDMNNKTNTRKSKQLFKNYVKITRPKSEEDTPTNLEHNYTLNEQRPNMYGKTIDINYFNRRKNGLFSNENTFDDNNKNKEIVKDSTNGTSNSYSMRIINILKENRNEKLSKDTYNDIESKFNGNKDNDVFDSLLGLDTIESKEKELVK